MESDRLRLLPKAARGLIFGALTGAGPWRGCGLFRRCILDTELSGLRATASTGCSIIASMCSSGKVDGKAFDGDEAVASVAFRVDAKNGFAHPAIEKGFSS